jgi:GPI mannosyltransferase 3
MAFAILGVFGWLFFVDKRDWISLFIVALGIMAAIFIGVLIDHWFYGQWVFIPYNYLNVNLLQGKAGSVFGVMPFWWYVPEFIARMTPPVSVVLLLLAVKGFKSLKNHILIWAMVPFIVVHFMIGHKELRFLFPALSAIVLLAAGGWNQYLKHPILNQRYTRLIINLTVFVNLILLLAATFRPASDAVPYYQFLYETTKQQGVTHLIVEKKDPYEHVGLPTSFYKHPNMTVNIVESVADLLSSPNNSVHDGDLVLLQTMNYQSTNPGITLEKVYCYYPDAIKWVNFGNWQSRTRIWTVYRVKHSTRIRHGF